MRLTFLLFLLVTLQAVGAPIDRSRALRIALDYQQRQQAGLGRSAATAVLELAYEHREKGGRNGTSSVLYYVFNRTTPAGGYLVVPGSDHLKPVLADTPRGTFRADSLSPGVRWWFGLVAQCVRQGLEQPALATRSAPAVYDAALPAAVSPLLTTTWGQYGPYNLFCPFDSVHGNRSVSGCVAVAIAQVMNYYRWPLQGVGSHSYATSTHGIPVSFDFAAVTFDWDNMLPAYDGTEPVAAQTAVARLIQACGAVVDMDYCSVSSNAEMYADFFRLLTDYFGYDRSANTGYRTYYTESEWSNLIRGELSQGRPVLYGGYSSLGGHEFVCHGYNTEGLFAINWGWNGMDDGYYELASLNPFIGVYEGDDNGFTVEQDIVYGIRPDVGGSTPDEVFYFNGLALNDTVQHRDRLSVGLLGVFNRYSYPLQGKVGVALYQNNRMVHTALSEKVITSNTSYTDSVFTFSLPPELSDGTYTLRGVYQLRSATSVLPMIGRKEHGDIAELHLHVHDRQVTFTTPPAYAPLQLEVVGVDVPSGIYQGTESLYTFTLRNKGTEHFNGILSIENRQSDVKCGVVIPPGTDKQVQVLLCAPVGQDRDTIRLYDGLNKLENWMLLQTVVTEVRPATSGIPGISLHPGFALDRTHLAPDDTLFISGRAGNSGGFFGGTIRSWLRLAGSETNISARFARLLLDRDEHKSFRIAHPLKQLPPGDYEVQLAYKNDYDEPVAFAGARLPFTVSAPTGVDAARSGGLSATFTADGRYLLLTATGALARVELLSVSGRLLATHRPDGVTQYALTLPSGLLPAVYLLRVTFADGSRQVLKFVC